VDLNVIDQYGLPIAMLIGFGWYIIQRTKFLEETLTREMNEDFNRLESIIVQLISQIKLAQLKVEEVKGYIEGLNDILAKIETTNKKEK
jgi:FtsZ-binding cell division protein ZapB